VQERRAVATLTGLTEPETDRRAPPAGAGRRLLVAASVAAGVVLVDQLTKWWAVDRLARGPIHVGWKLDLELARNTGSAFSLFQGDAALLVIVALALLAGLVVLVRRSPSTGRAAVLGLVIGGALGNLADRLFRSDHGAVVDFVALHVWPTFNVADSCIVVGCVLLAVSFLRGGDLR
jgi:signal peptidase II